MNEIKVNILQNSYAVYTGSGIVNSLPDLLLQNDINSGIAVISNKTVADLHLDKLKDIIDFDLYLVPDGEDYKHLETVSGVYDWLIEQKYDRNSVIISFGGGVAGDIAGFAAATYLRGINLVHVPTTLLAQVDSSIGGKTGVNHRIGKNLIGSFYQPVFVLSDTQFISTLPQDEFICGMGEVVKYGLIKDPVFFEFLESNFNRIQSTGGELLSEIVNKCSEIKAQIVAMDEKETGLRKILNFGHTFGHALENFFEYGTIKHGQAVIMGMMCAVYFSHKKKFIDKKTSERIIKYLSQYDIHLPGKLGLTDVKDLIRIMTRDKKVISRQINLILIRNVGDVFLHSIDNPDDLAVAFEILG